MLEVNNSQMKTKVFGVAYFQSKCQWKDNVRYPLKE